MTGGGVADGWAARTARTARRALAYEAGTWRSLRLWVTRRPAVAAGEEQFGYARAVTPVLWTFVVLSAIEIPVVHLLLPWPTARTVLLVLGAYALLWMIGLLASLRLHPHTVGRDGLRVRYGATVAFLVPWEAIAAVRSGLRSSEGMRTVRYEGSGEDRVLSVVISNQTNTDVVLGHPLPGPDGLPVGEVRVFADDPTALVRRLRAGMVDPRAAGAGEGAR